MSTQDWTAPMTELDDVPEPAPAEWRLLDETKRELGWCIYEMGVRGIPNNIRRVACGLARADAELIVQLHSQYRKSFV